MCVKQTCSRTIQTSSADHFVRGAHHRRCAREGLTGFMMPHAQGKLQANRTGGTPCSVNLFVRFGPFCTLVCQVVQG
jgi:hypothetical protein